MEDDTDMADLNWLMLLMTQHAYDAAYDANAPCIDQGPSGVGPPAQTGGTIYSFI